MSELDAILRTIREVETSLERRSARAEGALLMIWGLVGAVIFAFYQLVVWNHDPYHAALGPWLNWMWVLPMAVGYVASGLVGARLGRMGADAERRRRVRAGLVPAAVIAVLAAALVLTGSYDFIYGGVTLVAGLSSAFFAWRAPPGAVRAVGLAVGGALAALGVLLLATAGATWAPGAASLGFLVGYLLLGTVRYRLGR
ncbi:MAG TPA: hypothetical protein VM582_00370 [Candidatus Thermoplasmatota archaeon]|nr:hypothetical protein [Candidatus Thermoplasmatota archaeon]